MTCDSNGTIYIITNNIVCTSVVMPNTVQHEYHPIDGVNFLNATSICVDEYRDRLLVVEQFTCILSIHNLQEATYYAAGDTKRGHRDGHRLMALFQHISKVCLSNNPYRVVVADGSRIRTIINDVVSTVYTAAHYMGCMDMCFDAHDHLVALDDTGKMHEFDGKTLELLPNGLTATSYNEAEATREVMTWSGKNFANTTMVALAPNGMLCVLTPVNFCVIDQNYKTSRRFDMWTQPFMAKGCFMPNGDFVFLTDGKVKLLPGVCTLQQTFMPLIGLDDTSDMDFRHPMLCKRLHSQVVRLTCPQLLDYSSGVKLVAYLERMPVCKESLEMFFDFIYGKVPTTAITMLSTQGLNECDSKIIDADTLLWIELYYIVKRISVLEWTTYCWRIIKDRLSSVCCNVVGLLLNTVERLGEDTPQELFARPLWLSSIELLADVTPLLPMVTIYKQPKMFAQLVALLSASTEPANQPACLFPDCDQLTARCDRVSRRRVNDSADDEYEEEVDESQLLLQLDDTMFDKARHMLLWLGDGLVWQKNNALPICIPANTCFETNWRMTDDEDGYVLFHDWIVYSRWPYFQRLVQSHMSEVAFKCLHLPPTWRKHAMVALLRFIYSSDVKHAFVHMPVKSMVLDCHFLVEHAGELMIDNNAHFKPLLDYCHNQLCPPLNFSNAVTSLVTRMKYGTANDVMAAKRFVAQHLDVLFKQESQRNELEKLDITWELLVLRSDKSVLFIDE